MISRGSLLRAHRWSQPAVQLKALTDWDPCCLWALVMCHEPFPSLQAPSVSPSLAIRQSGSIIPTHETHDRLAPSRDIYICFFSSVFPLHLARLIEIINILVCINKTHANLLVPLKYQPICHIFIPHMEWQGEFQNVKLTDMERVRVDTTENVGFILVETRHRQHRSRHRGL